MEALQRPFLSSACSLAVQVSQTNSRSQPTTHIWAHLPSSATLKRPCAARRNFYHGSNEFALKMPTIAHTNTSCRNCRPCTVIVMRNNAAGGYADALAEIGRSQNVLEGINMDMEKLGRYLQDKQLNDFLNNPTITEDTKKSVLKSLADEAGFVPYTLNLLNLIVDRKRTRILGDIVEEFEELYNQITDTEVAIVTSAVKINTSQLAQIAKKVQSMSGAKNVRMKNVIDASLIAGFIVKYGKDGSRLIDMSVKGQLDRIAKEINSIEQLETVGA